MQLYPYGKNTPSVSRTAFIAPGAFVIGDVTIGALSGIWFNAVLRGDIDQIVIGDESNIQDNATLHVDRDTPTHIGDKVTVGHNAMLHGCRVENGVLVGIGAIILNGAVIGADSIIAAGSLITPGTEIPPRSLVMGSPGKVVRVLDDDQLPVAVGQYKRYVELAREYLTAGGPGLA